MLGDPDALALDQIREAEEHQTIIEHTPAKRGRKRKVVEEPVSYLFAFFVYTLHCTSIA